MKIILSRKGFDSGAGGVASPMLPDGRLCSLPIPEPFPSRRSIRYQDIQACDVCLGKIVNDLTGGNIRPDRCAHLDPDLDRESIPRATGWRPLFGQAGAAEKHLQNQGVGAGDIFVFFGWFKQVEEVAGRYRYVPNAPGLHVIFGWLQVERRIPAHVLSEIPDWAHGHPHCKQVPYARLDSLYVATKALHLPGTTIRCSGAGRFQSYTNELCLTAPGRSRSVWRLPHWWYPRVPSCLSYHSDLRRWERHEDGVLLRCVGRGQEFVLDCEHCPEALGWLERLLCLEVAPPDSSSVHAVSKKDSGQMATN